MNSSIRPLKNEEEDERTIEEIEEEEETLWYKIKEFWHYKIKQPIKYFYQRRTRGFDNSEVWDLYSPLSKHILPRLKAFREMNTMGCPNEFFDEKNEKNECQKWNECIDKMIFAFEYIAEEGEDKLFKKHYPNGGFPKMIFGEPNEKGLGSITFPKKTKEEQIVWDNLQKDLNDSEEKVQQGTELFGKYFQNLWD